MTQSDTPDAQQPAPRAGAKAVAKPATGAPTLKQALLIIGGTGAVAVLIGLLPRFQ